MRALKIVLITVAAAVLLIVAAAAFLFFTLSDDGYRRLASYLFERATGRTLIVDGRFAVHRSLRPSLVMSHVRIPNPAWAAAPEFAADRTHGDRGRAAVAPVRRPGASRD